MQMYLFLQLCISCFLVMSSLQRKHIWKLKGLSLSSYVSIYTQYTLTPLLHCLLSPVSYAQKIRCTRVHCTHFVSTNQPLGFCTGSITFPYDWLVQIVLCGLGSSVFGLCSSCFAVEHSMIHQWCDTCPSSRLAYT